MQNKKNTIPTSFTIDLSTIDKKVNKLLKYFYNCSIDLESEGLTFANPQLTYETLSKSLENRAYKENLSRLINDIYTQRFIQTREKLKSAGVIKDFDLLIPEPMDDFGSRFDAFAATNTDPDNSVLKILNVKPYKFLKVDIHDEEEITNYMTSLASSSYDLNNLTFLLNRLDQTTNSYMNDAAKEDSLKNYILTLRKNIFFISNNEPADDSLKPEDQSVTGSVPNLYNLIENVPDTKLAALLMEYYSPYSIDKENKEEGNDEQAREFLRVSGQSEEDINFIIGDNNTGSQPVVSQTTSSTKQVQFFPDDGALFQQVLQKYGLETIRELIGRELFANETKPTNKDYKIDLINGTKIKLIDFIVRTEIQSSLQEKMGAQKYLSEFKSKYSTYTFGIESGYLETEGGFGTKSVRKEDLFFKLTFLRETEEQINEQKETVFSNLNIELINKQTISLQSPFGSVKNSDKFVAVIGGTDIALNHYNLKSNFFEPTMLSILSDIDNIDRNLKETDPYYCPTPQSLQPDTKIQRDKYIQNSVFIKKKTTSTRYLLESKNFSSFAQRFGDPDAFLEESNIEFFNYKTFPDKYFILNMYPDPMSFFVSKKETLTKAKTESILSDYSRYSYYSTSETPISNILRDENSNKMFREALLNNGFFGLYEAKKDSFSDPLSIQKIINQLNSLDKDASKKINDIIFARTNIACLLKEFQTCFMPKVASCREILTGFRFSELETIVEKAFPESVYPQIFEIIKSWKIKNLRNETERRLLEELDELDKAIKNSEKKKITFRELDKKINPAEALNIADREIGPFVLGSRSLEEAYQKKLVEYNNFKLTEDRRPLDPVERIKLQKQMNPEEFQMIDDFLDMLEGKGVDVSVLCDFAKLIADLSAISFSFGTFTLPELPKFDLFQETKLSIDLSIVKLIYDSIVAFILKILEELLTCGGIKDLLQAALTGEAGDSLSGALLAAANKIVSGDFDLDDFVSQNPQIDPLEYAKSLQNLVTSLTGSVTMTEISSLSAKIDLGYLGSINSQSKQSTVRVLTNPKSSAVTELEIKNSLSGLISSLSNVMEPVQFLNVVSGRATDAEILIVAEYIESNQPELSYLGTPSKLKSIFGHIGSISGLDEVRDQLYAVSSFYSSNRAQIQQLPCLDSYSDLNEDADESPIIDTDRGITDPADYTVPPVITPTDTYRQLLVDLLDASPDSLKKEVDNNIFKPLLLGMLPGGSKIKNIEKTQKEIIKNSFKHISKDFKENCNNFYSKLAYRKKVKITIEKELETSEGEKYENSEYKDEINKGGYPIDYDKPITKEEYRYVYGGVFTEYFNRSSKNLSIKSNPNSLNLSLVGLKAFPNEDKEKIEVAANNTGQTGENSIWKIESIISQNENKITLYEGTERTQDQEIFSYTINSQQDIQLQSLYENTQDKRQQFKQLLKDKIKTSFTPGGLRNFMENENSNIFQDYVSTSYEQFIALIYNKITNSISKDGLLKPINLDSLNNEIEVRGLKQSLESVFPFLSLTVSNSNNPFKVKNPNIDTTLKYINFCPKPTKQQKDLKVDPGLYGQSEIEKFVYKILSRREENVMSLETIEEILKDKDNILKRSMVDGLFISLIRAACADICLRAIFPLRVFKYDKKFIDDLMIPTLISETLTKEIMYFSNSINKQSLFDLSVQHITFIHDFIFLLESEDPASRKLFVEIDSLKKDLVAIREDSQILTEYIGKIVTSRNQTTADFELKTKIQEHLACLAKEAKEKTEKIFKLQIRNIAYNELLIMFDKLSYITSTNEKIKESLGEECKDDLLSTSNSEKEFLTALIPELLIDSDLYQITTETVSTENFLNSQESKFTQGANLLMEHFIDIPIVDITSRSQLTSKTMELSVKQLELRSWGPTTFGQALKMFDECQTISDNDLLSDIFPSSVKYGMRLVYIPDTNLKEETSIIHDSELSIIENFDNLNSQGRNKFSMNRRTIEFKLKNIGPAFNYSLNRYKKTYSIPFLGPQQIDGDRIFRKFGLINSFPIIEDEEDVSAIEITTVGQLKQLLQDLKDKKTNNLTNTLRRRINCNEMLAGFYDILTNENLVSNMMILSSINILSSPSIKSSFSNLRFKILNDIFTKITLIYNENEFEDLLEKMSTLDFFKQFNAELIIKKSLQAAVYVLQYYCQMTDPNISIAMIIRNAVKLALSAASQIPTPFAELKPPAELPIALTPLAIYSIAQLPITMFGVPPVGIGIGPPLTPPGFVLLAAEIILLSLDFAENLDENTENDKIKQELKKYCFDLSGYKKYRA